MPGLSQDWLANGGPAAFAEAVDSAMTKLGSLLRDPEQIHALLLGEV